MATIVPHGELMRKALVDLSERIGQGKPLAKALDETASAFNLSPKDAEFLERLYKQEKQEKQE